jgi:DNA-binding transcriptional ArsR family regulator
VVTPPDVFAALASPVRRSLLDLLADAPHTVQELAAHFDMKRPSVSEHLKLLKDTGLVQEQRAGRNRVYRLDATPLRDVADWLNPYEKFWRERLRVLAQLLDAEER